MEDRLREVLTTALDVLGVLAVAAGVAAGLYPVWGWWSVSAAGVVVLVAVRVEEVVTK